MRNNLFSTKGRIRRSVYWARFMIAVVINVLIRMMISSDQSFTVFGGLVSVLVAVFLLVQGIKRMHDVNKSGWYILFPLYNFILAFTPGTKGSNDYGADPKAGNEEVDEIYIGIVNLLLSALLSCFIYAVLAESKIINGLKAGTIMNTVFLISFVLFNYLLLVWNKGENRANIDLGIDIK